MVEKWYINLNYSVKKYCFREKHIMKNSLKQVNLDRNITILENKLVKMFIAVTLNLQ